MYIFFRFYETYIGLIVHGYYDDTEVDLMN